IGVKPLYYNASPAGLAFASEINALRELSLAPFAEDPQAIFDFFAFRYVPAPQTIYRGVQQLLPGCFLLADSGGVRVEQYWDAPPEEESSKPESELAEEVSECLRECVRLRQISDVPLGLFLSGGMDSGAVLSFMAELGARPIRTFSVGFEEPGYSELPFARAAAQRYQAERHELILRGREFAEVLPRLASIRAEPLAEPTDVALYEISRLAARSVKVALAGEGGDEVFAGYPKYAADKLAGISRVIPSGLLRTAASLLPFSQRRVQVAMEALATHDEGERYAAWFSSFTRAECEALFSPDFLAGVDRDHPGKVFNDRLKKAGMRTPLKRMLYADLKIWLPDNLLLRGDQITMAASIEERVPLLDHRLVELAAKIPDRLLVRHLRPKAFFRNMLASRLPAEVLAHPKVGFAVPVGPWFRGPLKEMLGDLLLSPQAAARGYFNAGNVKRYLHEHWTGVRDRRKQLWALLSFELWQRNRATP
ncbi:MAG: asparagine synthetase B family protein, partial [Terriglobia bacterium]